MGKILRTRRRDLLAGSGLALIDALLPTKLLAAPPVKGAKRVRYHSIQQVPGNPFFAPVGGPQPNRRQTPSPFHGEPLSTAPQGVKGAELTPGAAGSVLAALTAGACKKQDAASETSDPCLDTNGRAQPSEGKTKGLAAVTAALAAVAGTSTEAQAATPSTLVLYDTTGQWGWLGELYAIMASNLASHFGAWTAKPVTTYASGDMNPFTAVIYIGSTYDEPLPAAFLDDVYNGNATKTAIIWISYNIWQLTARQSGFAAKYGWNWSGLDFTSVGEVDYKSQKLKRYAANQAGIMNYTTLNTPAQSLATCVRSDNTTFPWAVRSLNLTYIGENPFVYLTEGDRYLIFCDLLFDALAPITTTRHRAFVRLEDIDPSSDTNTNALRQIANWLSSQTPKVPFGFQIVPRYLDPNGYYNNGVKVDILLRNNTSLVSTIKYMQSKGGILLGHGYTHQYSNVANPYTGVTNDDAEFYRLTENVDLTLNYVGPVSEDTSPAWTTNRINLMQAEFTASGLTPPTIHTFPCYAGSSNASLAAAGAFPILSERKLYFSGLLAGGTIDSTRFCGQYFPYTVKDVYSNIAKSSCRVLADTLGGIEPLPFAANPARPPADILADAQRLLVVRDGVGVFFFHPSDSISYLRQVVTGMKTLGYTFVDPNTL
jgi:uncharacterized protein YdaL